MNILIVEDDAINQMLYGELMKEWNYDYDHASDGMEAIALAWKNQGQYDCCLMDINMPKLDGIEATKIIRKITNYFPILGLTANDDYEKTCYEVGMDAFAVKPCRPDELFVKINELTVKLYQLINKPSGLNITKVMPMDQKHALELRELKKQNLIKIKFDDINGAEVIVHENIINKIVDDFNIKKQFVSTFLNRDPSKPSKCVLFGNTCRMPQIYLDDEDYAQELQAENEEAKNCLEMRLKFEPDD